MLQSLAALNVTGSLTVQAHGGYKNNFWDTNDLGFWTKKENLDSGSDELKSTNPFATEDKTVELSFGNITIYNLLVQSVDVTVSKILCRNHQPLWIKMTVGLRGVKALLVQDLQRMIPDAGLDGGIGIGLGGGSDTGSTPDNSEKVNNDNMCPIRDNKKELYMSKPEDKKLYTK